MLDKDKDKQIRDLIDRADHERVESYMHMFDRILLYTLAASIMPKTAIEGTMDLWDKVVKKGIDIDSTKRTNFLEGTTSGRTAKLREEPDGEDLRIHCIEQLNIARDVIMSNLKQGLDDRNGGSGFGEETCD